MNEREYFYGYYMKTVQRLDWVIGGGGFCIPNNMRKAIADIGLYLANKNKGVKVSGSGGSCGKMVSFNIYHIEQDIKEQPLHVIARSYDFLVKINQWLDRCEAGHKRHEEEINRQCQAKIMALKTVAAFS